MCCVVFDHCSYEFKSTGLSNKCLPTKFFSPVAVLHPNTSRRTQYKILHRVLKSREATALLRMHEMAGREYMDLHALRLPDTAAGGCRQRLPGLDQQDHHDYSNSPIIRSAVRKPGVSQLTSEQFTWLLCLPGVIIAT